jgi:hypothetical protein
MLSEWLSPKPSGILPGSKPGTCTVMSFFCRAARRASSRTQGDAAECSDQMTITACASSAP